MASYSANDMILYNDLNGAYQKYQTANARWRNHWWETVVTIFQQSKKWAKEFILDPVKRELRRIGEKAADVADKIAAELRYHASGAFIHFAPGVISLDVPGSEKIYLFKFYEVGNPEPIFSKIGTTTRTCFQRVKEEISYYLRQFDIEGVEVEAIHDCGAMPAESYESFLRAMFTKKFPNTWKKNDRFFGVDISPTDFSKACARFAALEV